MHVHEEYGWTVPDIKVIGVGGFGVNAMNSIASSDIVGVEFIALDMDIQHLNSSLAPVKISISRAMRTGTKDIDNSQIGIQAELYNSAPLLSALNGVDMVFVIAGIGGCTGTKAAPVVASLAKRLGILTVAIVLMPSVNDVNSLKMNVRDGVSELRQKVDTLIVVSNSTIHRAVKGETHLPASFTQVTDFFKQIIQTVSETLLIPGLICLEFEDIKRVLAEGGVAEIGFGMNGQNGVLEATRKAISSSSLRELISSSKKILINMTGGLNMSIDDIKLAVSLVDELVPEMTELVLAAVIKPEMKDDVTVIVIAKGLEEKSEYK